MNFSDIAKGRYSVRKYDSTRQVEKEKLSAILDSAILAPSACNSQPYRISVCQGEVAKSVALATQSMGLNRFTSEAPVMIVISEQPYSVTAAAGSKIKKNDYRSIDIGILSAYITAQAHDLGLGTCIIGWFDNKKIREICSLDTDVRLVISLGYALNLPREKKRKNFSSLIDFK